MTYQEHSTERRRRPAWAGLANLTPVLAIVFALAVNVATQKLAQDQGAAGTWQKLRKLQTTASAMHTTAHPDDEHGGVLATLGRGQGVRVSMLTLTRGESGDNAIGPELFDALGLIRTEELLVADRYYGVDRQYFTNLIDYGFSKRLDEALDKWGREDLLREVVRVIRQDRPFVLIARFQGNDRDGHGNHQAAGLITQEAFKAAADPSAFPDQLAAGLHPWQPLKLYMGGVRANEDWTVKIDAGAYDPVLGESYSNLARFGLSFQRSQNSGRFTPQPGPSVSYYKRQQSVVDAPAREAGFFDGIDTTVSGLYKALRKPAPAGAESALATIERNISAAVDAFKMTDPSASVPSLARALSATRDAARQLGSDPDVKLLLGVKERQIQDAIDTALGIVLTATAEPVGTQEPTGPFAAFAAPAVMPPVVAGQTFVVRTEATNRGTMTVQAMRVALDGKGGWNIQGGVSPSDLGSNEPLVARYTVTVPQNAEPTRPSFTRNSIQDAHYTRTREAQDDDTPVPDAPLMAIATYSIDGVRVELRRPVRRLEANLPYGYESRILAIVPTLAVTMRPSNIVVPLQNSDKRIRLTTEVISNVEGTSQGRLSIRVPEQWAIDPPMQSFQFAHAGERALYPFTISIPSLESRDYHLEAVATSGEREYREGYEVIQHRDLETRYLYHAAAATVRGIDVKIVSGLKVGYVMGVGDDVPSGLGQLGVDVQLLGLQDLATADLARFNAIFTGTRAYAVRDDLKTYNRRLLDYVSNGGNLIVLYNTQEFVPNQYAPFPADLPQDAEEVSEEDSPVEILAASDPVFNTPNRITSADFDNWVEQRGSKFWSTWDPAYTPMIATHDRGQTPQKGGWLHARYGKGHYTYFAYAFHRQLPYGVRGAYRLLANLLSLE
jgi:LmbE family N-acetylglucosaminyl deacetylase